MSGIARIIAHTPDITRLISAASRLVTTAATGSALFQSSHGDQDDEKLIGRLMKMGHYSVLEHASVTFSFEDVSVFVEQYTIQFRLASFTVKSRRYVDFGTSGYVIPESVADGDHRRRYAHHVESLFGAYSAFTAAGVPKEDARFVLPYCFCSNFICTMNLRELAHYLTRSLYGPGAAFPEIRRLAESMYDQVVGIAPFFARIRELPTHDRCENPGVGRPVEGSPALGLVGAEDSPEPTDQDPAPVTAPSIDIVACTSEPDRLTATLSANRDGRDSPRNLEHISFTFRIGGISLAALTHLTRHRLQSLEVPSLCDRRLCDRYVLPQTIASDAGLIGEYQRLFAANRRFVAEMVEQGMQRRDRVYLNLSGNTIDVVTTMNGRELYHFFALRTCNRAQWEIRRVAETMLMKVRELAPRTFAMCGPSCVQLGRCPEGKMTCGREMEMLARYGPR